MTAFRFTFDEDEEGFEVLEESENALADDDENEDSQASESTDDVIWETEED